MELSEMTYSVNSSFLVPGVTLINSSWPYDIPLYWRTIGYIIHVILSKKFKRHADAGACRMVRCKAAFLPTFGATLRFLAPHLVLSATSKS